MATKVDWRFVVGFEGLYEVSSEGRVRSLNYRNSGKAAELSLRNTGKGYLQVVLYKDKIKYPLKVHRLVAEAFIPNPEKFPEVNHLDEDKSNNQVSNLEWCTSKHNVNYGTRNSKVSAANTNGKLSKPVEAFQPNSGLLIYKFSSAKEAERLGFNSAHISSCCRGKRKTHQGLTWRFSK